MWVFHCYLLNIVWCNRYNIWFVSTSLLFTSTNSGNLNLNTIFCERFNWKYAFNILSWWHFSHFFLTIQPPFAYIYLEAFHLIFFFSIFCHKYIMILWDIIQLIDVSYNWEWYLLRLTNSPKYIRIYMESQIHKMNKIVTCIIIKSNFNLW